MKFKIGDRVKIFMLTEKGYTRIMHSADSYGDYKKQYDKTFGQTGIVRDIESDDLFCFDIKLDSAINFRCNYCEEELIPVATLKDKLNLLKDLK